MVKLIFMASDMETKITPEWIRLPKPRSRCFWSGLSRTGMNRLVMPGEHNGFSPPVKSKVLRQNGKRRGIRLVHYRSLMDFLAM